MKFLVLLISSIIFCVHIAEGQNEVQPAAGKLNDETKAEAGSKDKKDRLIKEITGRIREITQKAFKYAKTLEDKYKVVSHIKSKLIESARKKQKHLGIDDSTLNNYIDLIVRSIHKNLDKNKNTTRRTGSDSNKVKLDSPSLVKTEDQRTFNTNVHMNMQTLKEKLIKEISAKVDKISRKALEQIKNTEDIYSVLKEMKQKLISSARRRQKALNVDTENLNSYIDLILRSVEYKLINNVKSPSRRVFEVDISKEKLNAIVEKKQSSEKMKVDKQQKEPEDGYSSIIKTKDRDCENNEQLICQDVKFILKATCSYDDTELQINKICDGYVDCPDASDEKNCSHQILVYIHKTNQILQSLVAYISHQCLEDIEESEINSQNKILNDVLSTQVAIIKSHAVLSNNAFKFDEKDLQSQHTSLTNDVASVIMMTTNAIHSVLCKEQREEKKMFVLTRKMSEALDVNLERALNKIVRESTKNCNCRGQQCEQEKCPERCKAVCKNKYFLDRWICSDEISSIALDLVCDGKIDCFDESDEYGCDIRNSMTKIENNRMYDDIMRLILLKTGADDYNHVFKDLNVLTDLVKKLREATMGPDVFQHPSTIKTMRNETFIVIKQIYEDSLKELSSDEHITRIYEFLNGIAKKLMLVLKNSHTGNQKIETDDLCWCEESRCIMPSCTRPCQRACALQRQLTNHTCAVHKNISLSLEHVCNGKEDCPLGDDEHNCIKDICQRHHLLTLANTLSRVGDDVKSPSLAAVFQTWRSEAIEKVKQVEKSGKGRPTRPIIRRLLNKILKDLMMAYASVTVTRRNIFDTAKKEFEKVANTIQMLYRSCER